MYLIDTGNITDPYVNMAIEEFCVVRLSSQHSYLRFYQNTPSVIIGKHQNTFREIDYKYLMQNQIRIIRRISGGGAVFHDLGNINFSLILNFQEHKLNSLRRLLSVIAEALNQLGIPAIVGDKNDIMVDGYKISGSSQYTNMKKVLNHGTLLFNSNLDHLNGSLISPLRFAASAGVASRKSRVANLDSILPRTIGLPVLIAHLQTSLEAEFGYLEPLELTRDQWKQIQTLAATKYNSWHWNFGNNPEFVVKESIHTDISVLDIHIRVKKGTIIEIESVDGKRPGPMIAGIQSQWLGKRFYPGLITIHRTAN